MTPIEIANNDLHFAAQELTSAKEAVRQHQSVVRNARALVAAALKNYLAEFPIVSRESLVRDNIRAEQQMKKDMLAGKVDPRSQPRIADELAQARAKQRSGGSYIDRASGLGGNANDFARSNMRLGFRRGVVVTSPDGSKHLVPATTRRGA
jgi:hypothetical protein